MICNVTPAVGLVTYCN